MAEAIVMYDNFDVLHCLVAALALVAVWCK